MFYVTLLFFNFITTGFKNVLSLMISVIISIELSKTELIRLLSAEMLNKSLHIHFKDN